MSKRKFSKKEVAISIAAAALAIATVGGAVAIHKDSSNSNTGHSITVERDSRVGGPVACGVSVVPE